METKKFNIDLKKIGITAAKVVIGSVASFGTGYIISRYGKAAILPTDKTIKKVVMLVGASTLSCMVGTAAEEYVDKQIDAVVTAAENISRLGKVVAEDNAEFVEEEENV